MLDPTDPIANEFLRLAWVHHDAVFRFGYRLARDHARAEDFAQETFLEAWKSFERYDRNRSCRTWLYAILRHIWSHDRRRDQKLVCADSTTLLSHTLLYDPPTPENITEEEVLNALDDLPEILREAVLLADIEELPYREVATVISVPIGTVMSRVSRGRTLLRHRLVAYAKARGITCVKKA